MFGEKLRIFSATIMAPPLCLEVGENRFLRKKIDFYPTVHDEIANMIIGKNVEEDVPDRLTP